MGQQLKKFMMFLAISMLVMAYGISASRSLVEGNLKTDIVNITGTTEPQIQGCVNSTFPNVEACGSLGALNGSLGFDDNLNVYLHV